MATNLMTASRQWASRPQDERFQTLDALFDAVNNRRLRSRSADIDLATIEASVAPDGEDITFNHGVKIVSPTHWSFQQMSTWIKAPAEYLRRLPAPLAVNNINHGIQAAAAERGALKFMTVLDPEGVRNRLQAVTSTTYGRIFDADVVQCARDIVSRTNGKFYNPKAYNRQTGQPEGSGLYASDRDCFIFMIDGGSMFDVGERAQLNRGFFLSNSEVGSRTFKLVTFLFNMVCGNHIVWGAQDVRELSIRHTGNGPYRFATDAAPALIEYANASEKPIVDAVRKAQDYLLPVTSAKTQRAEVIEWLQGRKFSKGEAAEVYDTALAEEGDCRTLWHAVQGATAYARGFDFVDSRVDMETRAGNLLNLVK